MAEGSPLLPLPAPEPDTADTSLPPVPTEPEPLVAVMWPLGAALTLVVFVFAMSVVGGAIALDALRLHWPTAAKAVGVGVILIGAYATELWVVAWAARRLGSRFRPAVGLRRVIEPASWFAAAVGVAVLARLSAGWYALVLQLLHVKLPGENVDVTRLLPHGAVGTAVTFALLVIVAPFAEEVVFRGVLLSSLRNRWGDRAAIVGSALLFAAIHVNPYVIVPIFLLALGLGWLFVRSRSLWVSITCHASFNALGFAALMLVKANWLWTR